MRLSNNFTLEELTYSPTAIKKGIDNTPNEAEELKLRRLANEILQPIRDKYGHSIHINSGFRCPKLNASVGGAKTSQHMLAEAADISCTATSKATLFHLVKSMIDSGEIKVGQLIWEYGTRKEPSWIHVSLPRTNGKPNNQVLYLFK